MSIMSSLIVKNSIMAGVEAFYFNFFFWGGMTNMAISEQYMHFVCIINEAVNIIKKITI